jgi:hypothetical protein
LVQAGAQDQPPGPPDQQAQPNGPPDQQGQAPGPQDQQGQPSGPETNPANVARLSFVQGQVQVTSGGQVQFQQAVANMPLLDGSRVQTGNDGQAEVEFGDGSVARLTPNSSLLINHLAADSANIQQQGGLAYYELNVGQGHPAFQVAFSGGVVVPTSNAIFRLDLDNAPEVASMTGSEAISANGQQVGALTDGQSFSFKPSGDSPYTVSQDIASDSWDQWNQDRDQAISQEASAQTPVRDDSGSTAQADNENWNDLDYYGDWYNVPGSGNVWVPSGVDAGWDPYGFGYWGFYPGLGGYTWISGYPWGWLPYHCGAWGSYSFGWGWRPGGCGIGWMPIGRIYGHPGYARPLAPVWRRGSARPIVSARLVVVDRGAAARGPWGMGHALPALDHQRTVVVNGRTIAPIRATSVAHPSAGSGFQARGTSPGVRAALAGRTPSQARSFAGQPARSAYPQGGQSVGQNGNRNFQQNNRPLGQTNNRPQPQPNSRSTYVPRSMPTPHYSAPPRPSGGGGGGNRGGGGGGSHGGGRGR